MAFKRENKFLVEKWEDIDKLPERDREALLKAVSQIEANRAMEGKVPCHKYIVVNEDEPYSEAIWKLVEMGATDPESMKALLEQARVMEEANKARLAGR